MCTHALGPTGERGPARGMGSVGRWGAWEVSSGEPREAGSGLRGAFKGICRFVTREVGRESSGVGTLSWGHTYHELHTGYSNTPLVIYYFWVILHRLVARAVQHKCGSWHLLGLSMPTAQ